jgi:hypothetical protein
MTREDMNDPRTREDWMTEEIEEKLRQVAVNDAISCLQAQNFSEDQGIPMHKMKVLLDVLKIKVVQCQLGCF